jgi:hypothetical protein
MATASLSRARQQELYRELSQALARVPNAELGEWTSGFVPLLGRITWRRARTLGATVLRLGRQTRDEVIESSDAFKKGGLVPHLRGRLRAALSTATQASGIATRSILAMRESITKRPAESIPTVVVSTLAFLTASGGLDGDGGVPDVDLALGIEAHRSIFTHSILAGAFVEASLASIASLIELVHKYLPDPHDPIWDAIARHKDQYVVAAAQGASLGVAYHLFIDSAVEPAPYHDLPGEHSLATHQAVMGANAAAEALDVRKKGETATRTQAASGPETDPRRRSTKTV